MSQIKYVTPVEIGKNIIPVNLCCQDSDVNKPFYLRSIGIKDMIPSYIQSHKINPDSLSYIEITQIPEVYFEDGSSLIWVNIKTHAKSGHILNDTMDQFHIDLSIENMEAKYTAFPQGFTEWNSPEDHEAYNDL